MPATKEWTVEEVRAMQDESRAWPRYELVDGELLVTPSPTVTHQRAVRELLLRLNAYVEAHGLGEVLTSPADLELEPGSVLQPDIFVVPRRDVRAGGSWRDVRGLLLAVEIVSPSSARADRLRKRRFFQRVGVPEYWIVDADARVIERWRPADARPEILDGALAWHPDGAAEPLPLDLATFFARVHRDDDATAGP